ncbi:MAG: CAP domain-containing protein [bacterium]|nr:CAP domain-containing protein [bacterium]
MKNLLSILVVGLFSLSVHAFELPYKQLKKSYETDYEKTLDRAELWMKILPNNPAPYYYASLVHFEQAQTGTTARKRYLGLVKSLRYARELEKRKDQSFLERVAWDTLTPHLKEFSASVREDLDAEELYKLSAIIEKKARRFDWMKDSKSMDVAENDSHEEETVPASMMKNGQYFGMPSGMEIISSYNLQSEREVLEYINKERLKQGMSILEWDEDLAKAARYHAFDMGSQNYFDHDSHDRTRSNKLTKVGGTFERIRKFYSASFVNSENIAAGNQGAHDTYMQWYHSKGHYENMFNKSSRKIGIGVVYVPGSSYGYYWVMNTAH